MITIARPCPSVGVGLPPRASASGICPRDHEMMPGHADHGHDGVDVRSPTQEEEEEEEESQ